MHGILVNKESTYDHGGDNGMLYKYILLMNWISNKILASASPMYVSYQTSSWTFGPPPCSYL